MLWHIAETGLISLATWNKEWPLSTEPGIASECLTLQSKTFIMFLFVLSFLIYVQWIFLASVCSGSLLMVLKVHMVPSQGVPGIEPTWVSTHSLYYHSSPVLLAFTCWIIFHYMVKIHFIFIFISLIDIRFFLMFGYSWLLWMSIFCPFSTDSISG